MRELTGRPIRKIRKRWSNAQNCVVLLLALCNCAEFDYATLERVDFFAEMLTNDETVLLDHLVFEVDSGSNEASIEASVGLELVADYSQSVAVSITAHPHLPIGFLLTKFKSWTPIRLVDAVEITVDEAKDQINFAKLGEWAMWRGINSLGINGG